MAELLDLARQYQRALDGALGPSGSVAADSAGKALCEAMQAVYDAAPDGSDAGTQAVASIVLQTTLAASITTYFERVPWAAVQTHALPALDETCLMSVLQGLYYGSDVMRLLFNSAMPIERDSLSIPLAALLLRQVNCMCFLLRPLAIPACEAHE